MYKRPSPLSLSRSPLHLGPFSVLVPDGLASSPLWQFAKSSDFVHRVALFAEDVAELGNIRGRHASTNTRHSGQTRTVSGGLCEPSDAEQQTKHISEGILGIARDAVEVLKPLNVCSLVLL